MEPLFAAILASIIALIYACACGLIFFLIKRRRPTLIEIVIITLGGYAGVCLGVITATIFLGVGVTFESKTAVEAYFAALSFSGVIGSFLSYIFAKRIRLIK